MAGPETRDTGYGLANRVFSSLYTAMRAREAVEILEEVLVSGDGPATIGAQVARRAGIAASEVRGTYEGLWLLERSDEHARRAPDPDLERSRNASIRAEMHLDAGALDQAAAEAQRAIDLDVDGLVVAQATRTITDVLVSRGDFAAAQQSAQRILSDTSASLERWIVLSTRTLLARIALEQGRYVEGASAARAALRDADRVAEARVALLAETVLRQLEPGTEASDVDRESLPWAVRLPVLGQDARDHFRNGDIARAAGLAADVVVLADSCRLGRDAVDGRLTLAHALLAQDEPDQAATTYLYALEQAAAMPMPLRVADAFDGLATIADRRGQRQGRQFAAAARALRGAALRGAVGVRRPRPRRTGAQRPRRLDRQGPGHPAGDPGRSRDLRPGPGALRLAPRPAHEVRAPRGGAGRRRAHQPADRRGAVPLPAHRRRPPRAHLPQARHRLPGQAGGDGRRPALSRCGAQRTE